MKNDFVGNITGPLFNITVEPDYERLWDSLVELCQIEPGKLWGNNLRNLVDLIIIFRDDVRLENAVNGHEHLVGMADRQIAYNASVDKKRRHGLQ